MEEGRRCSLTGRGPEFEDHCEHFDGNEAEVAEAIKAKERTVEESVGIHGFLAFYLYFCVIGGIILTIISTLVSIVPRADEGLMKGAYSVVSASRAYSISWPLLACDILMLVSFVSIGIYTVVAFHKRLPNAVALAKTHLIWAAVTNGLVLLTGSVGNGVFDNLIGLGRHLLYLPDGFGRCQDFDSERDEAFVQGRQNRFDFHNSGDFALVRTRSA